MELFFPSVIILLLAAAVVFFLLPKFGPATLAIVSAILLAMGLYQHYKTFGTEYRFSTWQLVSFSPYFLVGGLFIVLAIFFLYTIPMGGGAAANSPVIEMPTIANMPSPNTSTNGVTEAINRTLRGAANIINGNTSNSSNKGFFANMNNFANNYIPGYNRNGKNRGLNFPFSQI
jgi:hypothetical protein